MFFFTLNLRCNICALDIDEKEIEDHASSLQHRENKSKILGARGNGSNDSVVNMWIKSLSQ